MVKLKNNNLKINKKNIVWTISMLGLLVFLIIFNKTLSYNKPEDRPVGIEYAKAEVINIVSEELEPDPDFPYINIGKQQLELKILTGDRKGEIVSANNFIGRVDNKPAKVGTKFIISSFDDFITTVIVNYSRETAIYVLVLLFMFIVFGLVLDITYYYYLVLLEEFRKNYLNRLKWMALETLNNLVKL